MDMSDFIQTLSEKRETAKRKLTEIEKSISALEAQRKTVEREFHIWDTAYSVALRETGKEPPVEQPQPPLMDFQSGKELSIPDLSEKILTAMGHLSDRELFAAIRRTGKDVTSVTSITASLNRYRPKRFDRDEAKKWYPVKAEEKVNAPTVSKAFNK